MTSPERIESISGALELNSNDAGARSLYASALTSSSMHEEALAEARRALEIDPLSLVVNWGYGDSLLYARRYDECITQLKKTNDLESNFASVHASLFNAYRLKGDYAESVEEFARHQELIGETQNAVLIRESFARGDWIKALAQGQDRAYLKATCCLSFHFG